VEVGLHPLALVVEGVDLVAAAVDLDAADLPALAREPLLQGVLGLLVGFRPGLAGRESGGVAGVGRDGHDGKCGGGDDDLHGSTPVV
jgi:hypothetical protein